MDLEQVVTIVGWVIYAGLALLGIWGWLCIFLALRQVKRRRFATDAEAEEFQEQLNDLISSGDTDAAGQLCAEPQYWYKAVPHLIRGALNKRNLSPTKLRQSLAARFEREVLASIDSTMASVNTAIKSAPMLGLLGTVLGMIGAFGKIAGVEHPNPGDLAGDINVALYTTAIGLAVAIPLVIAANFVSVRIRKLEDSTAELMQDFLEVLESSVDNPVPREPQSRASRVRAR